MNTRLPLLALICIAALSQQIPRPLPDGYALPNGWRITPIGKTVPTEDMVLHVLPSPDGRAVMALHSGFNPHGLVVIDAHTDEATQRIPLRSAWLGMRATGYPFHSTWASLGGADCAVRNAPPQDLVVG